MVAFVLFFFFIPVVFNVFFFLFLVCIFNFIGWGICSGWVVFVCFGL